MTTQLSQLKYHPEPPPPSWIKSATTLAAQARAARVWKAAVCLIKNRSYLERDLGRYKAMISDIGVSTKLTRIQTKRDY